MIAHIQSVLQRDLGALAREIQAFDPESRLWQVSGTVSNSAGNLCLHLIGNLNHFIGQGIGKTGYVRQRDLEFSSKDMPRAQLLSMIEDTAAMLEKVLGQMKPEDLLAENPFPKSAGTQMVTNEYLLLHLSTHLSYHLGQINYLRRLLN